MIKTLYPGVSMFSFGLPNSRTPVRLRLRPPAEEALQNFPCQAECSLSIEAIQGRQTSRGYIVQIPLAAEEQLYGLGLQLLSFEQRGKKKTLRVNSDPSADLGDSHAPVPFYVSTHGYGVLIDTARYCSFYMGALNQQGGSGHSSEPGSTEAQRSAASLYASRSEAVQSTVTVEVPLAAGADVYVFWGENLREAVQRYNLFSGGGCLPPRWGLGPWYRVRADFSQQEVLEMASSLRADEMPCDVLGLEPGWQSRSYPCSFVWSNKFPDASALIRDLTAQHYHVNLWTHVFTAEASPLYEDLQPLSGDYTAFQGLVPDLSLPAARHLLAEQHGQAHVDLGISGYKLDECDNSDFIGRPWSFPELSQFPSGLDGEQMHSLLGVFYQQTIEDIFRARDRRTYGSVRSSHALAAPHPFVLYSDLYGHEAFIRGVANCGFSGLLWTPEVRDAQSAEDLVRRLQTAVFSPQTLVNAWYIKNPPWKQWQTENNNAGVLADDWQQVEAICRGLLRLRMQLLPYLYAAFGRYQAEGLPPFRALVMDYPDDPPVQTIDDQYLMGDVLMVAPVIAGQTERAVYLPEGIWHDFWTGAAIEGKQTITIEPALEVIPVFVKSGALLPLAEPSLWADAPAAWSLTVRVYGDGRRPATLLEDDGKTFAYERGERNRLRLTWDEKSGTGTVSREGSADCPRYVIKEWHRV